MPLIITLIIKEKAILMVVIFKFLVMNELLICYGKSIILYALIQYMYVYVYSSSLGLENIENWQHK